MTKEELDRMRKAVEQFELISSIARKLINTDPGFLSPTIAFARAIRAAADDAVIALGIETDHAEEEEHDHANA